MEEQPITVRIYPGELRPVYYTSVLAFRFTPTVEVIRLSLERLQIFEDKSLYELYEGHANETKDVWTKLAEDDKPVTRRENWKPNQPTEKEMRFFLKRKEHASLVLTEIVSQYISPEVDDGRIEDMCTLEELSEQTILSNLRGRFSNKHIYTYVGSILISINPYYYYSVYNPKYTTQYVGKPFFALPPHIFAITDNAYHSMLSEKANQSVIISGESGAGKTESTKFLLHHLMSLSAKLDESQSLELITLGTGPVLEAFGNAMTVANDNSSRFGKFIQVNFKENGAYQGASIEKYLLEKSRIISQAPGERNYHVFYYLLLGTEMDLHKQLHLLDLDQYKYLTQGSSTTLPNSAEEYHRLRQSLSMLSFSSETQMRMFTVLSAILHIGNIAFTKKDTEEAAQIENMDCLSIVSDLLQVDKRTLWLALTTRKSKAGGTDCIVLPYRVEEALATRDSLAKALYGALFDWIVDQVNISLSSGGKGSHKGYSIGVLDIFGFEVFQKNSFEQFCINYANEQLQQYFNKHIFKLEQAEYEGEGIEWSSVTFVDNQECLDLIAKKPTGLLALLDEECSFPGADDHSLFQKFERQHKNNPHYRSPQLKLKDPQFTVLHYASEVSYSIQGFRGKNRDLMRQDIVDVLKTSRMDLVRAMIGLSPYAVHRWHTAYLKVVAGIAFRKAGKDHREKVEGRLSASLPFKFRTGSSPALSSSDYSGRSRNLSEDLTTPTLVAGHDSPDAFPLEYGGKLKTKFGIRTSRSYDLLTDAVKDTGRDQTDGGHLSSSSHGYPLGLSPRAARKTPPKPTSQKPHSQTSKPHRRKSIEGRDKGEGGRSRLPSISSLQDKLKRRWPVSVRSKEAPEVRERHRFWRSAPRVRAAETISDPSLLRSLSRRGPSKTVGGQFQVSLTSLMERLEKTNPFFIRCIKSNGQKAPCQFDDELVLRQLRYTGMMETVKIRKAGYSVRTDFEDFYERYQFLMGPRSSDLGLQIKMFLNKLGFNDDDIQIGKTKVFMREKQKQALQTELGDKVLARIVKIQRWVRAMMLRCRYLHRRRCCITIQCAVRCYLAKKKADQKRNRICSAVLIQSAWRSYMARKNLVLLKQAAIILQAHWKGRSARRQFVVSLAEEQERIRLETEEKERQRLEEENRRKEEEERRKEREEKEKAEALQREQEERERQDKLQTELEKQCELETDSNYINTTTAPETEPPSQSLDVEDSTGGILDSEVSDVLFHFDSIVNSLEIDTPHDLTPSPRPQSPSSEYAYNDSETNSVTIEVAQNESRHTVLESKELELQPPSDDTLPELDSTTQDKPSDEVSRVSPGKVKDLKKSFLYPKTSERTQTAEIKPCLEDAASSRIKVQDLIAQLYEGESSTSPEPLPPNQARRNSSSIRTKITEFTANAQAEVLEEKRRSYTPPLVRRKIKSPFFERSRSKSVDPEKVLDDSSPQEHHHPLTKAESFTDRSALRLTSSATPEATNKVVDETLPLPSKISQTSDDSRKSSLTKSVEDKSEPKNVHKSPDKVCITIQEDCYGSRHSLRRSESDKDGTLERKESRDEAKKVEADGTEVVAPEDIKLTFDTELTDNKNLERSSETYGSSQDIGEKPHVELIIGVKENGLFAAPPRIVESGSKLGVPFQKSGHYDRLISKTHYDHLPPVDSDNVSASLFRHRSASDVTSHRIKPLTGPFVDSELIASEIVPREYLSSEHYHNSLRNRRRAAVSVADPMDVSLHPISLEDSSEFTKGLSTEEISRLNQRQTLPSPSERLRLFSFHKRHLRLPFSRHRGKKAEKDREKLSSPDKDRSNSSTPTRHRKLSSSSFRSIGSFSSKKNPADVLLAHNFRQTTGTRFSIYPCEVCHKGFTGFMKHALKCVDCELIVHRHCDDRVPPCKAKIASGSYVTMSRNKVVKKLEDLDDLGRFLLDKISMLSKNSSPGSLIDRVFKLSLMEFHTSLISSYSLSLQSSGESQPAIDTKNKEKSSSEPRMTITFSQLVNNFSNIFKGIAKREGLSDSCTISIGINQIKTLLDEFGKARRTKRTYSASINPSDLMRKTKSGKDIQAKVHKGHRFFPKQFKVATVCEFCSRPIRLLGNGEVCEVCGYTCHEGCFKKTSKKCEGKERSKGIPEYNPSPTVVSNQFGKTLESLVPPNTIKIPPLLETCFSFLESNGLYTQGVYRKSAGVSSKKAVRSALEEDPENAKLDHFSVHAVASAVGSFFRELPEPLLTVELYVEFLRAMDLTDKKEKLETLHQLISRLPALNHAVFERLIFHLARLAQHQHINKMSPSNLAIIFSPCLLQGPPGRSPDEILKSLDKQTLCLEVIIIEQVEKLTATIRGIRTLDSYVRNTTSKLTQLIGQFENAQPSSESGSRKSSLTSSKPPATSTYVPPTKMVSDEKRKQLTEELEVLERERVQLTVNLPKLEPFFMSEEEQASGDSDKWQSSPSPSPSPTPTTLSPPTTVTRGQRDISPISEMSEPRISWTLDLYSDTEDRQSREGSPLSPPFSPHTPNSPNTPIIVIGEDGLPSLPSAPTLTHLTKNRTSKKPSRRLPSADRRRKISKAHSIESKTPISPLVKKRHHLPAATASEPVEYLKEPMFKETTV